LGALYLSREIKPINDVFDKLVKRYAELYPALVEPLPLDDIVSIVQGCPVFRKDTNLNDRVSITDQIKKNLGINWKNGDDYNSQEEFVTKFELTKDEYELFLIIGDMEEFMTASTSTSSTALTQYGTGYQTSSSSSSTSSTTSTFKSNYKRAPREVPFFFDVQDYHTKLVDVATAVYAAEIQRHEVGQRPIMKNIVKRAAEIISEAAAYAHEQFEKDFPKT